MRLHNSEGNYTAAFTCSDDTDADEDLEFVQADGTPVTVQNTLISTVDFVVPATELNAFKRAVAGAWS